jgi:hypothetical protein
VPRQHRRVSLAFDSEPVARQNSALLPVLVVGFRSLALMCCGHRAVALENIALRQQLAVVRPTFLRKEAWPSGRSFATIELTDATFSTSGD